MNKVEQDHHQVRCIPKEDLLTDLIFLLREHAVEYKKININDQGWKTPSFSWQGKNGRRPPRNVFEADNFGMEAPYAKPPYSVFALAFPVLMLFLFGTMYGMNLMNLWAALVPLMPNPWLYLYVIAVTGLMALPLVLAEYREQKILKRFMATPIQPQDILLSQLIVNTLTTLLGILLLIVFGRVIYDLQFFGRVLEALAAFLLILMSIFAIGLFIGGVTPNGRTAIVISYIVYFPMLFLSGATMPMEMMPQSIINISKLLPLTYGVTLLKGIWLGGRFFDFPLELGVVVLVTLVFGGLAVKLFRWE